jgi:hypothetical protein
MKEIKREISVWFQLLQIAERELKRLNKELEQKIKE